MHMCIQSSDMCSVPLPIVRGYTALVRDEQRIIAEWMRRCLKRKGWTGKQWAEKAGVNPSTVTRAMEDDYASVTSVPTIDALAKAAGATSPLDVLADDGRMVRPSVTALEVMLGVVLRELPENPDVTLLAQQLDQGFRLLERNPDMIENPDQIRGMAEALAGMIAPLQ